MNIVVLSTFDIWPPLDGGQNRYFNIWRNFSEANNIKIIVYDFRNSGVPRRYKIAPHVEVVVPVAAEHDSRLFHQMLAETGLWLHDVLCLDRYCFSSDFIQTLCHYVHFADVVVASHPYLASVAFPFARSRTLKVYESYNVEFDIKQDYFKQGKNGHLLSDLLNEVRVHEERAARLSDKVTVVSGDDAFRFQALYKIAASKIFLVPNGTNVANAVKLDLAAKSLLRKAINIDDEIIGVFLGSAYPGNVESYRRSRLLLNQSGFCGTLIVIGSIASVNREDWPEVGFEEVWFGFVEEDLKSLMVT